MVRPNVRRHTQDVYTARLLVEEAVGRTVRAPAFSDSAPGDAEAVALATQVGETIVLTQGSAVNPFGEPFSTVSAVLPVCDCSIQIRTIDPDASKARRPNGGQLARRNQVAQGPRANAAVELRGLEIEQPPGCPAIPPAAYSAFGTRWSLRLINELTDGRRHKSSLWKPVREARAPP